MLPRQQKGIATRMPEPIELDGGVRTMMAVLTFCLFIYFVARAAVPV
jgi:hypothetical protein